MLELIFFIVLIGITGLAIIGVVKVVKKLDQVVEPVYKYETSVLFKKYGILESFTNQQIKCKNCQTPVTFNNLCLIVENNSFLELYCDSPSCYSICSDPFLAEEANLSAGL